MICRLVPGLEKGKGGLSRGRGRERKGLSEGQGGSCELPLNGHLM
jgi:hypothetical protein